MLAGYIADWQMAQCSMAAGATSSLALCRPHLQHSTSGARGSIHRHHLTLERAAAFGLFHNFRSTAESPVEKGQGGKLNGSGFLPLRRRDNRDNVHQVSHIRAAGSGGPSSTTAQSDTKALEAIREAAVSCMLECHSITFSEMEFR